jgi:peptidoglycan-associated lipoprotein
MKPTIRTLKLFILGALVALGCASTPTSTSTEAESSPTENTTKAPQEEVIQPVFAPSPEPVYFDTDKWVLRADARVSLEKSAEAIRQHPEWGIVTIEGHCDERGAEMYNISLGDRRAMAVKRHLVDRGVPESRLVTVTYGEDRPAVPGHDERAWRYNRRSEFAIDALQAAKK